MKDKKNKKENKIIKKIMSSPLMIMVLVIVVAIISSLGTSYAASTYLYDSKDVSYDNTRSGITATNVQGAVDELYGAATDYSSMNTRVTTMENSLIDKTYPINSIYISVSNVNPSTLFGGTWVAFGEGRTLIGMGSNGTNEYTTVGATGGSATQTLTADNLPVHNHSIPQLSVSSWTGSHSHKMNYMADYSLGTPGSYTGGYSRMAGDRSTTSTSITVSGQKTTASNTNGCTNCNGTSFSTIDPYITVYMWKRTA